MGPSKSVPGTVAEVLGDLAATAELSLSCDGRQLRLSADGETITLAAASYRGLLALRHRPPGGSPLQLARALGTNVHIVVGDRHVATAELGAVPSWWQRMMGLRTPISISWFSTLRSIGGR